MKAEWVSQSVLSRGGDNNFSTDREHIIIYIMKTLDYKYKHLLVKNSHGRNSECQLLISCDIENNVAGQLAPKWHLLTNVSIAPVQLSAIHVFS